MPKPKLKRSSKQGKSKHQNRSEIQRPKPIAKPSRKTNNKTEKTKTKLRNKTEDNTIELKPKLKQRHKQNQKQKPKQRPNSRPKLSPKPKLNRFRFVVSASVLAFYLRVASKCCLFFYMPFESSAFQFASFLTFK
jgi:tRNA G10  N-methylase Trm11